ncbi:GPW/gp25 family protein [Teredinibacter turnerae]|uniref:Phage GpW/Gp25 family protein n=1 Tax=Teredinibacter turnerae (strain ATCC 39867 / T7901) TaxID=377629 RepID=C5BJK3_TERTT|nr:GPW/gp25 family protein [Teredinibacter turnerae]ACR10852.1 phage GpW/Gp25 family protein [Teredinibacter turnerae T7901]
MSAFNESAFLGTGWAFPPTFSGETRSAEMVSHDEDIKQSLKILFSTSVGERVMHPNFGCNLKANVFDEMTQGTITKIKDNIRRAVLFYETRISLERIEIHIDRNPANPQSVYNGYIAIELHYTVRTTNTRSNMVYPFYFAEADNL